MSAISQVNRVRILAFNAALMAALLLAILPWEISLSLTLAVVLLLATGISLYVPLVLLLVVAPLRTLVETESGLQLPLDPGQIAFLLFLVVYVVHHILKRREFHLHLTPLHITLGLFILVTGMSSFVASEQSFWFTEWLKWVVVLALLLIIPQFARIHWLSFSLIIAASANAIVGLYIFFGGSGADHLLIMGRFFRAFGTFGQPNPFGGFMGLILPITLMGVYGIVARVLARAHLRIHQTERLQIAFYSFSTMLLLAGLVASWSRGAWLGFVASVGVMVFALPRKIWQSVALVTIAGLFLLGIWFSGLLPESIVQRVTSSTAEYFTLYDVRGVDITSDNYAIVERLAHWQAALNMVDYHPWLGIGFGNYEIVYEEFRLLNWPEALGHAHNYYLNIMAEAGTLGFLSYIALWIIILTMTWRLRSHPDPMSRAVGIGLLGSWIYLWTHSLLDNLYVNNLFIHIGILLVMVTLLDQQIWSGKDWKKQ